MWVKICGTTNLDDALHAVEAGADAVGFIFVNQSRRSVTRQVVSQILPSLPASVMTVGVVANEKPDFVRELLRVCPLRAIQFHGEESPQEVLSFKVPGRMIIKTIHIKDLDSLDRIPDYRGVDAILLDSHSQESLGGTGIPFHWNLAADANRYEIPLIIAGGLHHFNVGQVIKQIHPFGVDVATGVEASPGKKDPTLIWGFVQQAKRAII